MEMGEKKLGRLPDYQREHGHDRDLRNPEEVVRAQAFSRASQALHLSRVGRICHQ
jgi:hypothetical protein